jgi:TRAP-type uncharacterized transport system fused permease subunit
MSPNLNSQTANRQPSHSSAKRTRAVSLPDGTRETEPLLLMLIAVAVPVGLVALAGLGGGIPLLILAIATMLLVCVGLAVFLKRLTRSVPANEGTSHRN